jgi:hypothetical protein
MVMATSSVALSTQRVYASTWKKWTVFMKTCHHNPTNDDINCKHTTQQKLLELLLMFVAYCINVLHVSPSTIPGILSGLKHSMIMKFVTVAAFDHCMIKAIKSSIARRPYEPRIRLPCTYDMILHIVDKNTAPGFSMDQLMVAVGVSMAYYLCLRASEYVSRTAIPDPESHQFDSKSVEFKRRDNDVLIPSTSMHTTTWAQISIVRFTIQHAKNVKRGHGVPLWFSTTDGNDDSIAFLHLIYIWSRTSTRYPDDPFLSYRTITGKLCCLVYTTIHKTISQCAVDFNFNPQWFKPHSVRMAAPTALRAAGGDDGQILTFGRWKRVPTSLIYQGTSTKTNSRYLRTVSNSQLFTAEDIQLTRLLPATKGQNQRPTVRQF